jgi:hypothetical protein
MVVQPSGAIQGAVVVDDAVVGDVDGVVNVGGAPALRACALVPGRLDPHAAAATATVSVPTNTPIRRICP